MQTSHKVQPHVLDRQRRGIKRDYSAFKRDGKDKQKTKQKKAAKYHNVIRCPVFRIELDRICPLCIHIVLGITKKRNIILCWRKNATNWTKKLLTRQEEEPDIDKSTHFGKHVRCLRRKNRKLTNTDTKEEDGSLKYRSGPTAIKLDKALKWHKIDVQSFHARSFTGNHCNKYLKDTVLSDICSTPVKIAQNLVDDPEIHLEAHIIQQTFDELNQRFSAVHRQISHDFPIQSASVSQMKNSVDSYMNFFRRNFPDVNFFPKQHILGKHCINWIRSWKVGLSMMGEQGGEQLHSSINALKRRAWAIKKEDKKKYNSLCVNITRRSLQHSGSTRQPVMPNKIKLCSQKQSAINEFWL